MIIEIEAHRCFFHLELEEKGVSINMRLQLVELVEPVIYDISVVDDDCYYYH